MSNGERRNAPDEAAWGRPQPEHDRDAQVGDADDEFVIGAEPLDAAAEPGGYPPQAPEEEYAPDDGYIDDEYYDDDELIEDEFVIDANEDDGYGDYADDDAYYAPAPGYSGEGGMRLPILIGAVVLAALLGGLLVFLAINAVFDGNGDDRPSLGGNGDVAFDIRMDQPRNNERIVVNTPYEVIASAVSDEPIETFTLFIDDEAVDQFAVLDPRERQQEQATFATQFTERGTHELYVEVETESGETSASERVTIVAIEEIDEPSGTIRGEVVADVTARLGPDDTAPAAGQLQAGDTVTVKGKTSSNDWLLVDSDAGNDVWIRRSAVELSDSLEIVPIQEPTPVAPTATPTSDATATPTETETPDASLPDFIPAGATLEDGGNSLRVDIQNAGGDYSGSLVVSVSGVDSGTLVIAFDVDIPAGTVGSVTFALSETIEDSRSADVAIDPEGAVTESSVDNNLATFAVEPTAAQPVLIVTAANYSGGIVSVTVENTGGPLPQSQVSVALTLGGNETRTNQSISLDTGDSADFTVQSPGAGDTTITVLVDDVPVFTGQVVIPGDEEPTEEPTEDDGAQDDGTEEPTADE